MNARVLTGIRPTGVIHLGHYHSIIKPLLKFKNTSLDIYVLVADLHALVNASLDKAEREQYLKELLCGLLAFDIAYPRFNIYLQSDIPEILETYWYLTPLVQQSLLLRSHAVKSATNTVNMSLVNYPILMAADILSVQANQVLVGADQTQHIEITRKIVSKLRSNYKLEVAMPEGVTHQVLQGLDGRKMSKSYGNTIPIFASKELLQKLIYKVQTDSTSYDSPKSFNNCILFDLYSSVSDDEEIDNMKNIYRKGTSWQKIKDICIDTIFNFFSDQRKIYEYLMDDNTLITNSLKKSVGIVHDSSHAFLYKLRNTLGIKSFIK